MDFDMFDALNKALAPVFQLSGNVIGSSLAAAESHAMQQDLYDKQKEMNTVAFERNKELIQQQRDWNLEDYDKLMRDTSPTAAAQRFRDAGMSQAAALMASGDVSPQVQQTSLAPAEAGSVPQVPQTAWSHFNFDLLGALRSVQALRKEKVEADKAEETELSDINGILDTNEAKRVSLNMSREELAYFMRTNPYSANSIRYKSQADSYLPQTAKLAYDMAKVNYDTAKENYGFLLKYHDKQFDEIQKTIDKLLEETNVAKKQQDVMASQENLNNANAALARANAGVASATEENIQTDTKGKHLQNYGQVLENAFKEHGMPEKDWQRVAALVESGYLPIKRVGEYLKLGKGYLITAQDTFNGSPELRNAFLHDIAPGTGEGDKNAIWSHGTYHSIRRGFQHYTAPKFLQDIWNP